MVFEISQVIVVARSNDITENDVHEMVTTNETTTKQMGHSNNNNNNSNNNAQERKHSRAESVNSTFNEFSGISRSKRTSVLCKDSLFLTFFCWFLFFV